MVCIQIIQIKEKYMEKYLKKIVPLIEDSNVVSTDCTLSATASVVSQQVPLGSLQLLKTNLKDGSKIKQISDYSTTNFQGAW